MADTTQMCQSVNYLSGRLPNASHQEPGNRHQMSTGISALLLENHWHNYFPLGIPVDSVLNARGAARATFLDFQPKLVHMLLHSWSVKALCD